jgi:5-methylcytosine-specific restriction endonuclease McrA
MPSVHLDGRFPMNRKIRTLSDAAFRVHVSAICQSATVHAVVLDADGLEPAADELAARGLWERTAARGWQISGGTELFKVAANNRREKITDFLRQRVYDRDGRACLHCGAADDLTLDHIRPWSLGGPDTFENLQTLCRSCNSSKGARV